MPALAPSGSRSCPRPAPPTPLVADRARDGRAPSGWSSSPSTRPPAAAGSTAPGRRPDRAALTFSTLLRPDRAGGEWPWLPLVAGVAAVGALREHGVPAGAEVAQRRDGRGPQARRHPRRTGRDARRPRRRGRDRPQRQPDRGGAARRRPRPRSSSRPARPPTAPTLLVGLLTRLRAGVRRLVGRWRSAGARRLPRGLRARSARRCGSASPAGGSVTGDRRRTSTTPAGWWSRARAVAAGDVLHVRPAQVT